MLPAIVYFILALVSFVSAYRAGSDGNGKQRLGMSAAGIGFILLGADKLLSPKDTTNPKMMIAAGIFLLLGVFIYWLGHLRK
jgi:hypothetical protein